MSKPRLSNLHKITRGESSRAGSRTFMLEQKGTKMPAILFILLIQCTNCSGGETGAPLPGWHNSRSTEDQNIHKCLIGLHIRPHFHESAYPNSTTSELQSLTTSWGPQELSKQKIWSSKFDVFLFCQKYVLIVMGYS